MNAAAIRKTGDKAIPMHKRFFCCGILILAASFPAAAAQNTFTDAEAEGVKAFLHDNFAHTRCGIKHYGDS